MGHVHDKQLMNRLKRAHGHLATIMRMIEEDRDGLEVAQQMQAVIGALETAKTSLVTDHIEHHLETAIGPLSGELREELSRLGKLAKYL